MSLRICSVVMRRLLYNMVKAHYAKTISTLVGLTSKNLCLISITLFTNVLKWILFSIEFKIYLGIPRLNSFSLFYPSRMWIWIREGQVDPGTGNHFISGLWARNGQVISEFERFQESDLPNRMNWTPFYKFLIRLKVFEDAFVKIFKKPRIFVFWIFLKK